jgi:hypothetical protein
MINLINYSQTADGYHGTIANMRYAVRDPQDLLNIAYELYPTLLFKLNKLN